MKKLSLFLFLLISCFSYGQDFLISDGNINTCSGVLFDSGGRTNAYQNGERFVLTICPDNPEDFIRLNFTIFDLEPVNDDLTVFNGNSESGPIVGRFEGTQGPGTITATNDTPTGCLTLVFQSDATTVSRGFEALIDCVDICQTITSQLDTASPSPNADGYIRVCPGEEISLTGSGNFSEDGTGASYEFDLGDGRTIAGQSATFSYPDPGVYLVNFNIRDTNTSSDPEGCKNTNLINQVIQVGNEPDFAGTEAVNEAICLGNETVIEGVVNPVDFVAECTPPVSGTTFLPDGIGVDYSTCITVDCFDSGKTLDASNELVNICINMEHSWADDLVIRIVSPDGRENVLFNGVMGEVYLGSPNDDGFNGDNPGDGKTYCFTLDADVLLRDAPRTPAGTPVRNGFLAGDYLPVENFDNLVGSPLNGEWCLIIRDKFDQDDGYIFEWNMSFDPELVPAELSFTPETVSEGWDADADIVSTDGTDITVRPTTLGQHCYTYRMVDDFGCEYTEEVCIDVFPAVVATEPETFKICDNLDDIDGFGEFDLSSRDSEILDGQDPASFDVNYFASLTDAQNNVNPLPTNYANTSNPQTVFARVDNSDAPEAICFVITELQLEVDLIPDLSLPEFVRVCAEGNGTEEVDDPILDTGLSEADYTFEWLRDGELIVGENNSTIIATEDGIYTVVVTDRITGCTNERSTDVVASSPPLLSVSVTSEPFASNNAIEASAEGLGEYEFSLNDGPFQPQGRFNNVPAGVNTVTARDINGCGSDTASITVLNFPKFFTPNNDGQNDTWNVKGINQPDAIVYIYDRYGKLLKQLNPIGGGWNGTFNGLSLPSSDYWFTIEFTDPASGNRAEYRSHFSLIR